MPIMTSVCRDGKHLPLDWTPELWDGIETELRAQGQGQSLDKGRAVFQRGCTIGTSEFHAGDIYTCCRVPSAYQPDKWDVLDEK